MKMISFIEGSLADLRRFPAAVRQDAGFQLERIQKGESPASWKPMPNIGMGVKEIRISGSDGIYRVIYVAKFFEAIYVLHCFQKKSQATDLQDIRLARSRLNQLLKERK